VITLLSALFGQEALGWLPYLTRRIITSAAMRLPDDHRERWHEEWLADLKELDDRPLTAFAYAVSVATSAGSLARELRPVPRLLPADSRSAADPDSELKNYVRSRGLPTAAVPLNRLFGPRFAAALLSGTANGARLPGRILSLVIISGVEVLGRMALSRILRFPRTWFGLLGLVAGLATGVLAKLLLR
jgi:hypothetical protein